MQTTSAQHLVTLRLPDSLFQKAQCMALNLSRSLEDVLLDAVATAFPPLAGLPAELAEELAALAFLSDDDLWAVARTALPPDHYQKMDALLARKQQSALAATEQQQLDQLLSEYQALILKRGQAVVLLQRRGYDMSAPAVLEI